MKIAYTIPEAVEASGISRSALYEFMKDGRLPRVRVGGRVLIRHVDLENFINERVAA